MHIRTIAALLAGVVVFIITMNIIAGAASLSPVFGLVSAFLLVPAAVFGVSLLV